MESTATEFRQNIAKHFDAAMKEHVLISRNGRITHVLMSAEEYEELMKLKKEKEQSKEGI